MTFAMLSLTNAAKSPYVAKSTYVDPESGIRVPVAPEGSVHEEERDSKEMKTRTIPGLEDVFSLEILQQVSRISFLTAITNKGNHLFGCHRPLRRPSPWSG